MTPERAQALQLVQEFERQVINLNKKMASEADFDDDHEAFKVARENLIVALIAPVSQPGEAGTAADKEHHLFKVVLEQIACLRAWPQGEHYSAEVWARKALMGELVLPRPPAAQQQAAEAEGAHR